MATDTANETSDKKKKKTALCVSGGGQDAVGERVQQVYIGF